MQSLTGVVGLLVVAVVIQMWARWTMRNDVNLGFRELAESHATGLSSFLALLAFSGFVFVPAFLMKKNVLQFVSMEPLKLLYVFFKGLLKVPASHKDLAPVFPWLWLVLTFTLPCLTYMFINVKVTSMVWEQVGDRKT